MNKINHKRNIPLKNEKYGEYSVISDPYRFGPRKSWYVDIKCKCGKIRRQPTGSLKKLGRCKTCNGQNIRKYKIGDTHYDLTLIDYKPYNKKWGKSPIQVQCKCGKQYLMSTHEFKKTKKCADCSRKVIGINHPTYKGTKYITGTYFSSIKLSAKSRNRKFDLTIKFLDNLLEKQNFKCYLSGADISVHKKTASLDRIDSSKNYTKDNVAWVHKDIQRMKSDFNVDYFIETCKNIAFNNKTD